MSESLELKDWKGDNLHIDSDIGRLDGFNKTWNFIVTERESGKTSLLWKKVYNAFKRTGRPSIIMRRFQSDISDIYVSSIEHVINKFTEQNFHFEYKKDEMKKGGQMDLKIGGKVFCRLIGLNTPLSRLKLSILKDVRYFMYDEFICNKRIGEKYLTDEPLQIKELYTTYRREASTPPKIYFFGNPYSLFNPFFSNKNVPTNELYPGALFAKDDYAVFCYQIKPELKAKILAENPLYEFDDAYKRYAFDGQAVQDANIRLSSRQPEGFKLNFVLKLHGKCVGVFHGADFQNRLFYWAKRIDEEAVGKRRDIMCFDFGDMADKTVLFATGNKQLYYSFKQAIERRLIAFASIEESWLIEEIYQNI